jgi:hypothetical protein
VNPVLSDRTAEVPFVRDWLEGVMSPLIHVVVAPAVLAMYLPFCATEVRPTLHPPDTPAASLWEEPTDLPDRDLFHGQWGPERAPDPSAQYTFVERKHSGVNPGVTVRDPDGRQWSVKQAPDGGAAGEGPVEVVLSRVLSAVGYHQPPVYFLPSFQLADDWGVHNGARWTLPTEGQAAEGHRQLVMAAEPVRRYASLSRPARHPVDVQQLRPEELEQHPVRVPR